MKLPQRPTVSPEMSMRFLPWNPSSECTTPDRPATGWMEPLIREVKVQNSASCWPSLSQSSYRAHAVPVRLDQNRQEDL